MQCIITEDSFLSESSSLWVRLVICSFMRLLIAFLGMAELVVKFQALGISILIFFFFNRGDTVQYFGGL